MSDPLTELFEIFLTAVFGPKPPPKKVDSCPSCGHTLGMLHETGRFGCQECYTFFGGPMDKVLAKLHDGSTEHFGKKPKSKETVESLKDQMTRAVETEDYETAGALKKKIKELIETSPTLPISEGL